MFANLKKLFSLLNPSQRKNLFLLQFLVIFMAFAEIASVFSIGPFMALIGNLDQLNGDGLIAEAYKFSGITDQNNFIIAFGATVISILTLSALISTFTLWRLAMYGAKVGADLGNRLFSYYMNESWLFHSQRNSSDLVNKISVETTRVTGSIILQLMFLNAKVTLVLFLSVSIFILDPKIALSGVAIFSFAYLFIYRLVKKQLELNGNMHTQGNRARFQLMSEGFGGIKEILLLGRQNFFKKRFFIASEDFFYAWGNSQVLSSVPKYFMELVSFSAAVLLVMYFLVSNQGNLEIILPIVSIYALAGFKLLPAFQQIYFSISTIQANIASYENIKSDLKSSAVNYSDYNYEDDASVSSESISFSKAITLSNISFSYPETSQSLISNLSIEFPKNQVIGLVGPSGSGKSTIIDILMGLVEPDAGELVVDSSALNLLQKRALQNSIGFVSQSIYLADSSIKENIAFGIPPDLIVNTDITRALKLANLEDVIQSLPNGVDTFVGERGVQLSGGQRQRIGIARALYNDPEILVFDEATSSLDGLTEKNIMKAIDSFAGQKTIILIAHRLSTVMNCNLIYYMENGEIIDQGTYQYLIESNANFKQMSEHS
ncbi:ABC transporter ATP-binding protein/permease [Gammaproteobacteria bacterium]|nr:ABC transporter ATP-binding protein/permease [Gammaproteobacteria bacterium]